MKYPALLKLFLTALLCLALLNGSLTHTLAQTSAASPAAINPPAVSTEAAKRQEAFDIVWTTVKEQFFDPLFGGVDWDKVRERYAPRVAVSASDEELHLILQEMLNELRQSHFLIIPPDAIPKLPPADDAEEMAEGEEAGEDDAEQEALDKASYKLTEQLTTGIGIDLRILDGSAVVTRVEPGSSAARAGLRPGYIIKRASGMSLDLVIEETLKHPMWQSIIRPEMHLVLLAGYINGESKTPVNLLYLDGRNRPRRVSVRRERLKGEMSPPIGNLPSMFTEFEARRLKNGIGYIRFNAFVPPLMDKLCGALRRMNDAPGIVIDLRGNQGGLLGMIGGLSGLVDPRQLSLGSMQTRTGRSDLHTFPQAGAYNGTLAVLVDGSTQSAAEIFASGMQENKRALVIGEQSAGNTLPSVIKQLPTGALFQYGFANFRTPRGIALEGRGVTPDINIKLSRRALLLGHDPQLERAVEQILKQRADLMTVNTTERRPSAALSNISARGAKGPAQPTIVVADPVVRVEESEGAAPPPMQALGKAPEALSEPPSAPGVESVESVLDKYLAARGGREALARLNSRVTKGTAEITSMNLKGTVELYEKAPNKAVTNISVPGLGLMQRGFDGTKGWWQDSMRGYIRISGYGLTDMRREADFYRDTKLDKLYSKLVFSGTEPVGSREAYVLQEMYGSIPMEKLYFDVETGLLLRRDNIYYEDYREVDGVRLPFLIREESANGFSFIFRITEVRHNQSIEEATFAESPSCFTRADSDRK